MNEIKINNTFTRKDLSEGKNYQMGFGFLKRKSEFEFDNVSAISACREYLNDIIYCELTKVVNNIYGLKYKFNNLFEDEKLYLSSSILLKQYKPEYVEYPGYKEDLENFKTVANKVESFLNKIEDYLEIKDKTKVIQLEDNLILLEFDKIWGTSTFAISLYTLLARVSQKYDESDWKEYLSKFTDSYGDQYNAKMLPTIIEKKFKHKFPEQIIFTERSNIHSAGILYLNKN